MTVKREKILHEICLVCVHKPLEIHEGLFRDSPKTLIGSGCYKGLEGKNYCVLANKAADRITSLIVADDQTVELLGEEEMVSMLDKWVQIDNSCMAAGTDRPSLEDTLFDALQAQASKMVKGDGKTKWMKVRI